MKSARMFACCCAMATCCLGVGTARADDVGVAIETILNVEKGGVGHAPAAAAVASLRNQTAAALMALLAGMDRANPVSENWLRGPFEVIAAREHKAGAPLPQAELEQFVVDRRHGVQPRKLAYDWLLRIDPTAADRLVPGMIDDPSVEFRREAVERLMTAAAKAGEANDAAASKELYGQAFRAALDPDQLDRTFDALAALGEKPDLQRQLGLLNAWWLIGPFDHRAGVGFDAVYPPETEIDLDKSYPGLDQEVHWQKKESDQRTALLDINALLAKHNGAVVYAYREFESDAEQSVEIRLGTPNAWKLWVNGQLAFGHEEYHQSSRMDQYPVRVTFHEGTNSLLLKVCQNEQTEDWAQRWEFQVRVCNELGAAVLPRVAGRASAENSAAE